MDERTKRNRTKVSNGIFIALTILLLALVLVKSFWIEPFYVSGDSMQPSFHNGQLVFANKLKSVSRYDVVILSMDGKDLDSDKKDEKIIKRVIALEGEKVWSEDGVVHVLTTAGKTLVLNETFDKMSDYNGIAAVTVPKGCVFVLGDNRNNSLDSRKFGCVSLERKIGVVL